MPADKTVVPRCWNVTLVRNRGGVLDRIGAARTSRVTILVVTYSLICILSRTCYMHMTVGYACIA